MINKRILDGLYSHNKIALIIDFDKFYKVLDEVLKYSNYQNILIVTNDNEIYLSERLRGIGSVPSEQKFPKIITVRKYSFKKGFVKNRIGKDLFDLVIFEGTSSDTSKSLDLILDYGLKSIVITKDSTPKRFLSVLNNRGYKRVHPKFISVDILYLSMSTDKNLYNKVRNYYTSEEIVYLEREMMFYKTKRSNGSKLVLIESFKRSVSKNFAINALNAKMPKETLFVDGNFKIKNGLDEIVEDVSKVNCEKVVFSFGLDSKKVNDIINLLKGENKELKVIFLVLDRTLETFFLTETIKLIKDSQVKFLSVEQTNTIIYGQFAR